MTERAEYLISIVSDLQATRRANARVWEEVRGSILAEAAERAQARNKRASIARLSDADQGKVKEEFDHLTIAQLRRQLELLERLDKAIDRLP